jgi:hypothetical protein
MNLEKHRRNPVRYGGYRLYGRSVTAGCPDISSHHVVPGVAPNVIPYNLCTSMAFAWELAATR